MWVIVARYCGFISWEGLTNISLYYHSNIKEGQFDMKLLHNIRQQLSRDTR